MRWRAPGESRSDLAWVHGLALGGLLVATAGWPAATAAFCDLARIAFFERPTWGCRDPTP